MLKFFVLSFSKQIKNMKKIHHLVSVLAMLIVIISTQLDASNRQNNFYAYSPEGKTNFKLSEEQILIKFSSNVSFDQQAALLKTEPLLLPLTKDMLLPAPKVTVAKINGTIGEEKFN
jgi:hypothetical protein